MRRLFFPVGSVFTLLALLLGGFALLAQATSAHPATVLPSAAGAPAVSNNIAALAVPQDETIPGAPLSVQVRPSGSYAVFRDGIQQFYGQWAEGPYLWVDNMVWGPEQVPAGRSVNPYTQISNTLTGDGSNANPWVVTTVLGVGSTGLLLTQQVSYVNGNPYIRNEWAVCNTGSANYTDVHLFHAADLYTNNDDRGYGYYDPATNSIGGYTQDHSLYQIFIPITPALHHQEDGYSTIWSMIGDLAGRGIGFQDTCQCDMYIDNGAGLEWSRDLPAGACENISDFLSFSNIPVLPTATSPPSATPVPPTNPPTFTETSTVTTTPTPLPPTSTPGCAAQTPTRVPTPAFTPAPGCSSTPPSGALDATITTNSSYTEAVFTNHSNTCSYPIGLAVYRMFDNNIDNQELYDYRLAVIPPNSTLTLRVNNPTCAYQADAFYGSILYSFTGGVRYGARDLDDVRGNLGHYCTHGCATPPATATQPPPPEATDTPAPATATPPEATGTPVSSCAVQFSDVSAGNPFYSYIRCLACRGILNGYGDTTFRPGAAVTRGQAAKIVANAAGMSKPPGAGRQTFADVPPSHPFWAWIEQVADRGSVSGYQCGGPGESCDAGHRPYFRAGGALTRGQFAKIVGVTAGYQDAPTAQTFADVPPSHPFYLWIERAARHGLLSGYQCGGPGEACDGGARPYFRAGAITTRGQTAKIVANTFYPGCAVR